jgi:hypothetical protein
VKDTVFWDVMPTGVSQKPVAIAFRALEYENSRFFLERLYFGTTRRHMSEDDNLRSPRQDSLDCDTEPEIEKNAGNNAGGSDRTSYTVRILPQTLL